MSLYILGYIGLIDQFSYQSSVRVLQSDGHENCVDARRTWSTGFWRSRCRVRSMRSRRAFLLSPFGHATISDYAVRHKMAYLNYYQREFHCTRCIGFSLLVFTLRWERVRSAAHRPPRSSRHHFHKESPVIIILINKWILVCLVWVRRSIGNNSVLEPNFSQ